MHRMRTFLFLTTAALFVAGCATQGSTMSTSSSPPVTTASGLVYQSLREGTGASPAATDVVKVHYRGTFPDGKEFDSSKGNPVEFPLNRVIKCWTEGVQMMKPGGKAVLICPAPLAYGE